MKKIVPIAIGLLVLVLIWLVASIYPDWLWFANLEFSSVFWTILLSKLGFGAAVWLVVVFIVSVNLYAANRLNPSAGPQTTVRIDSGFFGQVPLSGKTINVLLMAFVLVISFIIASRGSDSWDMVLRYFHQQPFGTVDPIFENDIGFYVFSLPFYVFLQNGLATIFFLATAIAVGWYLKNGALHVMAEFAQGQTKPVTFPKISISLKAKKHLLVLGGIIVLFLAWGFHLKIYKLLYSTQGPAFGSSYTDIHIKILGYRLLIIASIALAVALFVSLSRPRAKVILVSAGAWLGAVIVFTMILPGIVQKFVVKPNELAKESRYIAYNIDFTRKAYNLDKIKEVDFPVGDTLTTEDINRHNVTIQNIRIWDERPLLQTFRQLQAIRLYYDFINVDVDRYVINKQLRQVTLAAREFVASQLPPQANTWVNKHLIYTHGYGLALSPVNEVTSEGLPRLLIKDLPPAYDADLRVERPEVYYGEKADEYIFVNTKAKEFDYPKGDKNVYSLYKGKGGVSIRSFTRRVLFALEFLDPQILFTTYLSPESRIMYNRRIDRRVRLIAPFLNYDGDPYLVIAGGKLFWIQDAYTTSDMYPYSRRSSTHFNKKRLNYIRNSVKVAINAYDGKVSFYVVDETDPIIKTYASIFPALFKPLDQMPADLKNHIRYPKDLFKIQVDTYKTYHMDDVQVFYNQEDLWQIPDEIYGDARQPMEPYYIIMKLPEEKKEEFLLMLPFTPSKKDNMIGWLAARSDLPNFGNLLVYKLPKEKMIYGPMQIEARIDQQTDISRELSLWGQRGSRVIRGNLLAIPVSDSFIYVEPVYLEAKQEEAVTSTPSPQPRGFGKPRKGTSGAPVLDKTKSASLPELKRVIVAFGNRLTMAEELETALNNLLQGEIVPKALASAAGPQSLNLSVLGGLALEHYNQAKEHLRQGRWAAYGKALEELEGVLKEITRLTKEKQE